MSLRELPRIDRLHLAELVLPEFHPESAVDPVSPVFAYVIHHPDGPVLVDTGVGRGNQFLDEVYRPKVTDLGEALAGLGVDVSDVVAIINSHLHFDHCGQNPMFYGLAVPVYVQAAEVKAAREPFYTDPSWASVPIDQLRQLDGDESLAEGIRIVATPGHTAGHQSVIIEGGADVAVIAAQSVWRVGEFESGRSAQPRTKGKQERIRSDRERPIPNDALGKLFGRATTAFERADLAAAQPTAPDLVVVFDTGQ